MLNRIASGLLLLGLSCSASTALASSDDDASKTARGDQGASPSQRFGINATAGQAWVEFEAPDDIAGIDQTQRIAIPGLSYDRDSGQVVFSTGGNRTVCARVRIVDGRWTKRRQIEPTGACALTLSTVELPVRTSIGFYDMEHVEVQLKLVRQNYSGVGLFSE